MFWTLAGIGVLLFFAGAGLGLVIIATKYNREEEPFVGSLFDDHLSAEVENPMYVTIPKRGRPRKQK